MTTWYDQDNFWETFRPTLFSEQRWGAAPTEVDHLLALLNLESDAPVLDLCCGPGRHSLELARRGFHVTGVDRTASYLEAARQQASAEGLEVEFVQEDMRRFVRPGAFDAAINLFTSFGYFEDPAQDLQVAKNLYTSLKPGGKLVIEMMGKEVLARIFQPRDWFWLDEEEGVIMLEERKLSQGWGWIESTWTLLRSSERQTHTVSHRLYAGTELAALLRQAGFSSVELFGGLEGVLYDQRARRLVALAEK
jgi:SAM-dependent methyltransferase